MTSDAEGGAVRPVASLHERFGWWALFCFVLLGFALEVLHGFKAGFYLDVSNETRRHMWTLAHAHGTLLSVINIVFGSCQRSLQLGLATASRCLLGATFLLPGGFFLGGVVIYGGDPGLGIIGVPIGALLLLIAIASTAREVTARR